MTDRIASRWNLGTPTLSGLTVLRLASPLLCLLLGCAHLPHRTGEPVGTWIDDSTVGPTSAGPDRLEHLGQAGWPGRVIRLDRLLDLYDAARFAQDEVARETLWAALGGSSSSRGVEASREAVLRMLDEAYSLADVTDELEPDQTQFVVDAIALLSADLFLPDSAESLIEQTLAYRMLVEQGHPRIADNARFRLYDFVRGVLEGGLEVGPAGRSSVVVHALYAEREDISAWLEDRPAHARPDWPAPEKLWELLDAQRRALAEIPRWSAVLDARASDDQALHDTLIDLLPRPRSSDWVLAELPRGSGEPESLGPVVLMRPGEFVLDPSAGQAGEPDEAARRSERVEGLLARDGRGLVLLVADPELPAPEFAAGLATIVSARASTIELAAYEARLGDEPGRVVVALPLHIAHADETSPGARSIQDARIHVRLAGRGIRFAIDGRWLASSPDLASDLTALVARLHKAYPRERVVRLTFESDIQPRQLIELLAALTGGHSPAFLAVGWAPDLGIEAIDASVDRAADSVLTARVELAGTPVPRLTVDPPISESDLARLELLARSLDVCVPELERTLSAAGLTLTIGLIDGKLETATARSKGAKQDRLAAVSACARERLVGHRLADEREPTTATIVFLGAR